ncbi:hypothetical protein SFRURICE_020942 [Spodoptera frugiperda]|nr:hypothetical protein SFRURICE_020942 [Spodoptera frugiperda]
MTSTGPHPAIAVRGRFAARVCDVSIVGKPSISHISLYKKPSSVSTNAKLCVSMNMIGGSQTHPQQRSIAHLWWKSRCGLSLISDGYFTNIYWAFTRELTRIENPNEQQLGRKPARLNTWSEDPPFLRELYSLFPSGTVCASDLDGCGAVLYMYLNNRSDTLRGMPPPRSDSYREKKED